MELTNEQLTTLLYKAGGNDDFQIYIAKQLDWVEDELYQENISAVRYIELKGIYNTLKEVRDKYYEFKKGKTNE